MGYDKRINLRLSKGIYEVLKKRAEKEGINISEVLRNIIVKSIAQEKTEKVLDLFLAEILQDEEIKKLLAGKLKEKLK